MNNMNVFHMGPAMAIFEALKLNKLRETIVNSELGVMGATKIETWSTKLGSEMHMYYANGGCTLYVGSLMEHK